MESRLLNDRLFDAFLETAICEDFIEEIGEIDWSAVESHVFPPGHEARIKRLLKMRRRVLTAGRIFLGVKRAAVAVLVLLSVAFVGIMSVDAVRTEVFHIVTEWYEKYVQIIFQSDEESGVTNDVNLKTEGMRLPEYIPEGYEQGEIVRSRGAIYVSYFNADGLEILYEQSILTAEPTILLDSEERTSQEIEVNGYAGLIFLPDNEDKKISIVWNDGEFSYWIDGYVDIETIINISESVKPAE